MAPQVHPIATTSIYLKIVPPSILLPTRTLPNLLQPSESSGIYTFQPYIKELTITIQPTTLFLEDKYLLNLSKLFDEVSELVANMQLVPNKPNRFAITNTLMAQLVPTLHIEKLSVKPVLLDITAHATLGLFLGKYCVLDFI